MFEKTKPFRVFFWLSLLLIGFFVFFPLLWMINTALKPTSETFSNYFLWALSRLITLSIS